MKYDPTVKIIVGGPYVINKAVGMEQDKLIELFNSIGGDYYIKDPSGEDILVDVVNNIKQEKNNFSTIRNLYYKENNSFKFSRSENVDYDFNNNRIDWELFKGKLAPVMNLRTAVSCPYKCSFCNFPLYAGKYSLSPLEYCEKEFDKLHEQGVKYIQFIDDTFNVPIARFKDLLKLMIRKKYDFKWNSYFKCQYADEEVIALMKESGCQFVFLGIESGSQVILDNMNKKNNVEIYRECLELFNKYDIMTMCSIIVGYPGETVSTFQETISFIEEARPTFYQQRLWWYDNTAPVYQDREKFKIKGEGYYWEHETMNADEAHQLADQMFLNIKNAIHITEYSLPFFLLGRGLDKSFVKSYLRSYMHVNREQYLNPGKETSPELIKSLAQAACSKEIDQWSE